LLFFQFAWRRNGEAAARPSLPAQRQVTKRSMQNWLLHQQMLRNPPTARMRDVQGGGTHPNLRFFFDFFFIFF
jgi:hypothetical protein